MTNTVAVVILCSVLLAMYLAVTGIVSHRRARYYREIARAERVRRAWGDSRSILVMLALRGDLRIDSPLFEAVYAAQTYALRYPGDYRGISARLQVLFASFFDALPKAPSAAQATSQPSQLTEEQRGAIKRFSENPEVGRLFASIARGIVEMLRAYPKYTALARIAFAVAPRVSRGLAREAVGKLPMLKVEQVLIELKDRAEAHARVTAAHS